MKGIRVPSPVLVVAMAGLWLGQNGGAQGLSTFVYEGEKSPVPPGQEQPWTREPVKDSEGWREMADAAEGLFAAGWADPRGCEYREIVIPRLNSREEEGQKSQFATHGWVLPGTERQRYAVAWDGLVYPVISTGKIANLAEDVKRALEGGVIKQLPGETELAPDQASPAKVVMLRRLGRDAEAEQMWRRLEVSATKEVNDAKWNDEYWGIFPLLAGEWLHTQMHRAVGAHVRGQTKLALAYLEPISERRARVAEELAKRGGKVAEYDPQTGRMGKGLKLAFLDQVPALMADARRRLAENTEGNKPGTAGNGATKKQRIAELIRGFEEVEAYQMISPGYLAFSTDPGVIALAQEGENAVEPLIDCLANDTRLTRSVDGRARFGWTFGTERVVGVEEPALVVLQRILKSRDQFPNLDLPYVTGGPIPPKLPRQEVAKAIRDYWEKYRGKSLEERWYDLLADDNARPRVWAEAAENLTLKESQPVPVYGWLMPVFPTGSGGDLDRMRGKALEGKTNPSIAQLMARRLKEAQAEGEKSDEPFPRETAERLAKALATWDGGSQFEALRQYGAKLAEAVARETPNGDNRTLGEFIHTLLARKEAGDKQALPDYAQWLHDTGAPKLSEIARLYGASFFAPFWRYPHDPVVVKLTKEFFADPASPWVAGDAGMNPAWVAEAARTPLVAVPDFRALLLKALKDETVAGMAQTGPPGQVVYARAFARSGYTSDTDNLDGPKHEVRLNDKIAQGLSEVRGLPEFSLSWPGKKRDAAIAEIAAFVRRYGDRWTQTQNGLLMDPFRPSELRFPVLDHPATKADVAAGRAIYSREGEGERRMSPLEELPMRAQWTTLKDYPYGNQSSTDPRVTDQEVRVWQAEETMINGKWERTFGVVAKHRLAAAPAEEIRLIHAHPYPGEDGWWLDAIWKGRKIEPGETPVFQPGAAVLVAVRAQNMREVTRHRPGPGKGIVNASALGLQVKVDYSAGSWSPETFGARKAPEWQSREAREPMEVEITTEPDEVEARGRRDFLELDLARGFDLSASGTYRVLVTFKKGGAFEIDHAVYAVFFRVEN